MTPRDAGPDGRDAVTPMAMRDVLQDLYEFAPVGCALTAEDGTILHANQTLAAILGVSHAEVVGTSLVARLDPVDRIATLQFLARADDANGDAPIDVHVLSGGCESRACVLSASRSEPRGAVRIALTDATRRRAAERAELLAHKMDAIGRMAGGIAHDLNNVLTVVRVHADFMFSTLPPDDAAREDLHAVRDALHQAASLTARLLAFARPQVLDVRRTDVHALVDSFVRAHRRHLAARVELTWRPGQSPAEIEIAPGHVEQVLAHLVRNAEEAMPDGGALTIETASVHLGRTELVGHVGIDPGWFVRIRVSDTGIGMDSATLAHVFEPYFTTKRRGYGHGLGLPTVYAIARQCGGFVSVASEQGRGTTCEVYLPEAEAVEPASLSGPSVTPASGTETLLIAEDEPAIRAAMQRMLEKQGYVCHVAVDGDDALRKLEALGGRIDLLVSDIVMPNRTGPELVRSMRERYPAIPVVFMTGFASTEDLAGGAMPVHFGVLHKPFALHALQNMVRAAIDAAQCGAVVT
jgi:signal transduction histidine kinase/CheY-like chemotaxis protein